MTVFTIPILFIGGASFFFLAKYFDKKRNEIVDRQDNFIRDAPKHNMDSAAFVQVCQYQTSLKKQYVLLISSCCAAGLAMLIAGVVLSRGH